MLEVLSINIVTAIENVAGRNIVIDVKNSEQLVEFYRANGYEIIKGSLDIESDILRVIKTK